jgi:hypothetical protein
MTIGIGLNHRSHGAVFQESLESQVVVLYGSEVYFGEAISKTT